MRLFISANPKLTNANVLAHVPKDSIVLYEEKKTS